MHIIMSTLDIFQIEELTDTAQAYNILQLALADDPEFAWAYHCNIAVSFQDEGGSHEASNKAAARAMSNMFSVDTSKNEHYLYK